MTLAIVAWVLLIAFIVSGCALALGDGSTACVNNDSRTALALGDAASAPRKMHGEPGTATCQGGKI